MDKNLVHLNYFFSIMEEAITSTIEKLHVFPLEGIALSISRTRHSYARYLSLYAALCDVCDSFDALCKELWSASENRNVASKVVYRSKFEKVAAVMNAFGATFASFYNHQIAASLTFSENPYLFRYIYLGGPKAFGESIHLFGISCPISVVVSGKSTFQIDVPTKRPPLEKRVIPWSGDKSPTSQDAGWVESIRKEMLEKMVVQRINLSDKANLTMEISTAFDSLKRILASKSKFGKSIQKFFPNELIFS